MAYLHKDNAEPSPPWPWWTNSSEYIGTFMWTNSKFKDFQIVVDDLVINVHKCVLAARSPVFAAMLNSGLTETKTGQLIIQDFDFDTVEMAIKFCYSQRFTIGTKGATNIWNLLKFGHKYDVQQVIKGCLSQIKDTRKSYDRCERKILITSAVNLGCDEILDSILDIFGTIDGELVPKSTPYNYKTIGSQLFQDGSFKDLKIICDDGREFSAHKFILALRSPVFAQIFESTMDENGDTSGQLTIDRIKSEVVEKAVRFLYIGFSNGDFKENSDLFLGVLEFADRFKVEELASYCLKKIYLAKKNLRLGVGQEVVSNCIKTAFNFESKKILNFILGIFGTHCFGPLDFDIEKASSESYWN